MPLAAYGGAEEIMGVLAPEGAVYQAGTLSGNPIAVTAGLETLKELKAHPEIYSRIDENAGRLAEAFRKKGLQVNRAGSLLSAFFTEQPVTDYASALTSDTEKFADYFSKMLEAGIYMAPSQFEAMFVSAAHSREDILKTEEAIALL